MPTGRYAPSPTGSLHLGNLRTALVAWLAARSDGSRFDLRFEDLDRAAVRGEHYVSQSADLVALGLNWDGEPIRQSDRVEEYQQALRRLQADDAVYPCFCSRREIREAAQAPNGAPNKPAPNGAPNKPAPNGGSVPHRAAYAGHSYPGTCRHLSSAERAERSQTRPPALRLRADGMTRVVDDRVTGPVAFALDDFVVQRNDGVPAYHLVVVVDDAAQGVDLVVRADDLLESAARQLVLYECLGFSAPAHAHVPLVLGPDGSRLAKRHGAVTLADRARTGDAPAEIVGWLAASLGLHPADATPEACPAASLACTPDEVLKTLQHRPDWLSTLPTTPMVLSEAMTSISR